MLIISDLYYIKNSGYMRTGSIDYQKKVNQHQYNMLKSKVLTIKTKMINFSL